MPISQPPSVPPPAIVLLETIGQNAALRHASPAELAQILAQMQASEALRQAAASGNDDALKQELGTDSQSTHVNQNPHHGFWDPAGE